MNAETGFKQHDDSTMLSRGQNRSQDDSLISVRGQLIRRETAVLKHYFMIRSSGKPWVQAVEVKVEDIKPRIYDIILLCWGISPQVDDLDFYFTQDEDASIVATVEGLSNYVAQTMAGAVSDYQMALADTD